MKNLRKITAFLWAVCMVIIMLPGCAGCGTVEKPETSGKPETSEKPDISETGTDAAAETPSASGTAGCLDISVMSYNLSADETTVSSRAEGLISTIRKYQPDSLGVQESRGSWSGIFRNKLGDLYGRVGVDGGGDEESTGAYFATYIYYLKDKYTVVDSGTFWLSKTPEEPSIYDSTVDCPRTCTWVILEDKATGVRYAHVNSHLDWMNTEVNKIQIQMIAKQITYLENMGYPVLATGDYNTDEGSASYKAMLKNSNIADSKYAAEKTMSLGTYPDYGAYDVTVTSPIDFCFVTKAKIKVSEYKVIDEKPNGQYASDHFPIYVTGTVCYGGAAAADKAKPVFGGAATSFVTGRTLHVTFPRAEDSFGGAAASYTLAVSDSEGKKIAEKSVKGNMYLLSVPETFSIKTTLPGEGNYTATLTAKSLLGEVSDALTLTCTAENYNQEELPQADLFDLIIKEGSLSDGSQTAMKIEYNGAPAVGDDSVYFDGTSNLIMKDMAAVLGAISGEFTMEISFKMDNVTKEQGVFACMHAGGLGFYVESGKLLFYAKLGGGDYKILSASIKKSEVYHALATYNGSAINLYVNGELVDSITASGSLVEPTDPSAKFLALGADSDASGRGENRAQVTVYNARLYSVAVSESAAIEATGK